MCCRRFLSISTKVKVKKKCCVATRHAGSKGERRIAPTYSWHQHYMGVSGQHHALAALYRRERTLGTHWIAGWLGFRAGLDTEARGKTLCLCQGSSPGHPVSSQTLYWLSYPISTEVLCLNFAICSAPLPQKKVVTSPDQVFIVCWMLKWCYSRLDNRERHVIYCIVLYCLNWDWNIMLLWYCPWNGNSVNMPI
jgi:hypothetical protein